VVTVFHDLPYREGPNLHWRLDLALKKENGLKPRPAIVVIHGGGWREGDKSSFASRDHGLPGNIEDFADLGFVAVTINYRLAREAPFPAALEDCKCAVRWLRAHAKDYNVDPNRIGAYGNSAGGHLALMLGMVGKEGNLESNGPYHEQSSRVQAVVSDSGQVDLLYQYEHGQLKQVVGEFLGGPPDGARIALYRKASPICQISSAVPPLLLIYGVADGQVPVETADQFVVALDRAGLKDVTYYRLAGVDHCPHSLIRIPALRSAVNDFFRRTLMPADTRRR
jgi:acetyl esterase/lipase